MCGEWWGPCCVGQAAAAAGRTGLAGSHRAGALWGREGAPGSGVAGGKDSKFVEGEVSFSKNSDFPPPCFGPLVEGLFMVQEQDQQWNFS